MSQISALNTLLGRRHTMIIQKNHLQWLRDGDKNSAFLHRLHNTRTSRATIKTVHVGEQFLTVAANIGQHIVHYYTKLFERDSSLHGDYSILHNFNWQHVSTNQSQYLTASPSIDEVRNAVFGLDPSSSPGQDSFNGYFFIKNAGSLFWMMFLVLSPICSLLLRCPKV